MLASLPFSSRITVFVFWFSFFFLEKKKTSMSVCRNVGAVGKSVLFTYNLEAILLL